MKRLLVNVLLASILLAGGLFAQALQAPTIIVTPSNVSVSLIWDDTTNPAETTYRLYHRLEPTAIYIFDCATTPTDNCKSTGTNKSFIWGPAANGINDWIVRAVATDGTESENSNEVTLTLPIGTGPPGPAGPAGPVGPTGPAGVQGNPGAAGAVGPTGAGYRATSTTNIVIGTGSKVFTTQSGLAYTVGARVRVSNSANTSRFMDGNVTAYSGTSMTVTVDAIGSTGTYSAWDINIIGLPGPAGGVGPQGAQGPAGPQGAPSTVPGPAGPQGGIGLQGAPGPAGAASTIPGPQGIQGVPGPPGAASTVPGPTGPAGAASTVPGPQGVAGPKGDSGADSIVPGVQGPMGPQGVQGPPGPSGTATVDIWGPQVVELTSTATRLSWSTQIPTTSRIEFYSAPTDFQTVTVDTIAVNVHTIRFTNLKPATTYNYNIICEAGVTRFERAGTFRTR